MHYALWHSGVKKKIKSDDFMKNEVNTDKKVKGRIVKKKLLYPSRGQVSQEYLTILEEQF